VGQPQQEHPEGPLHVLIRGRVQGVVTDPLNAAISQATVTLLNSNTKMAHTPTVTGN